jgi:uncharacterized protein (TIGR02147 family)
MQAPNLFEYLEVQYYLLDLYKYKKATVPSFSYALWASDLGIKSRGHLRDIVTGQVEITENLIPVFIQGLGLNSEEIEYFTLLVRYSTASSRTTKAAYGKVLVQNWKIKLHQLEIQDLQKFLSDSIIPVVFTYLSFDDTSSEVKTIANSLNTDTSRIQEALRCLIWQKLVDGHIDSDGIVKYKTVQPYFKIPDHPNNEFLKTFHMEGLKLAMKSHDLDPQTRKFLSTFVALSPQQFEEAQDILRDCGDKILGLFESPTLDERAIYRINFQLFPASV